MSPTFSVVVPVLDGARYLPELLEGLRAQQRELEVLVIDSGSTDGSVEIARAAGVDVLEIPKAEFGHGRTRNLGAERTSGDLIAFLTQDATPLPGWLDAYEAAFALADDVGAAFGPHRPRPDTSVMIARELTEFFAGFTPDGGPALLGPDDPMFLSNVNACYRRECWSAVRFDDVRYAEDQAFARAMHAAGWRRAYHPDAAVLHAHDYSPVGFMRRYFDEYRGLHATSGHVERIGVRSVVRHTRSALAADRAWMREQNWSKQRQARSSARSLVHHASRKFAAAAGSQAHRLPEPVQGVLSLEGATPVATSGPKPTVHRPPAGAGQHAPVLEVAREGAMPLLHPVLGMEEAKSLHIAVVIPPFRRGSGGHSTIFNLMSRLEERGHTVSTWLFDPRGLHGSEWAGVIRGNLREYFRPISGPVFKGFDQWYGADVALATGWDTVYAVERLHQTRARAYLVQDHEPEFFATSAESTFAENTYTSGLYCIAASPWLKDLVHRRYGADGTSFQLGVDHDVYKPRPITRRRDTVIFYARSVTARRAVPLGLLALEELQRRRPDTRFVLFGDEKPVKTPFAYEDLGVASPEQLSWAYSEATVGLSLSLTNYSLIPQEMLACGLPCVELAGRSVESVFGADGPIELATADPVAIADALERLLDDRERWERRSQEGLAFAAGRTWEGATDEVEEGLYAALRARAEGPVGKRIAALGGPLPPSWEASARTVPPGLHATQKATDQLYARLTPDDVAAVRAALDDDWNAYWEQADEAHRRTLTLVLGASHSVPAVLEKTGLRPDLPPDDVHAMARGPLAGGGALYYADMLADIWDGLGADLGDLRRGLDFGCSSGRVVRALQATYPDTEWHGVDPNADAIAWAREHLPAIRFDVSPQDPPLPFPDAHFDFVVAISIWSHYGERSAIRWLEEMHRVIEPGGRLAFSTHGAHSVAYYAQTGERSPGQLAQIRTALYRDGYWFAGEFGEEGDWGVKHAEWGTAFFTPEWLARIALPRWTIEHFGVGQNAHNQDMYVLRRK